MVAGHRNSQVNRRRCNGLKDLALKAKAANLISVTEAPIDSVKLMTPKPSWVPAWLPLLMLARPP